MMGSKYQCFKFEEESIFEKNIESAYDINEEYDDKMDNGSNSINSKRVRIKVRKIKAVKKIDDNNYSEVQNVWYYEPTYTVYDNDLHYAIGKLGLDKNNQPMKLEEDIYIIDKLINIPIFKLYE